jgi:hypothetical protein
MTMNRRTFLNFIIRGSIITGLALLTGTLIFRRKEDKTCNLDFVCKNCGKSTNCSLPEAQKYRQNIK